MSAATAPVSRLRLRQSAWPLLALAAACGSRQLTLELVTGPGSSLGGVSEFRVRARWDGGQLGPVAIGALEGSAGGSLPNGVPLDLEVDGDSDAGEWRGELHDLQLSPGPATLQLYFAQIGTVASYPNVPSGSSPALAGQSIAAIGPGQLLVTGGRLGPGLPGTRTTSLWDQASFTFQVLPTSTALPWADHLALALGNGQVLLAGGSSGLTDIELFDPLDGGQTLGNLSAPQLRPSGVVLADGRVALGCGEPLPDAEVDADAGLDAGALIGINIWHPGGMVDGPLNDPRTSAPLNCAGGQLVALDGGSELVALLPDGSGLLLDAEEGVAFSFGPRQSFAVCSDSLGGDLIAGGISEAGAYLGSVADPFGGGRLTDQLAVPRGDLALVAWDGGALAIGGAGDAGPLATAQLLGPQGSPAPTVQLGTARRFPAAAAVPGYHLILILSGEGLDGLPAGGLDLFSAP